MVVADLLKIYTGIGIGEFTYLMFAYCCSMFGYRVRSGGYRQRAAVLNKSLLEAYAFRFPFIIVL